jgi:hypothetical protein
MNNWSVCCVTSTDRPFNRPVFHFILYFLYSVLKLAEVEDERVGGCFAALSYMHVAQHE